jgi:uncharacterized protein YkwD
MFHVKNLLLVFVIMFTLKGYSQGVLTLKDKPFEFNHQYDSSLLRQLTGNSVYRSLSVKEQELYYWTNYFRQNPERFYTTVIKQFLEQFPEARSAYSRSLENDIKKAPLTLSLLVPDYGLLATSKQHATDLVNRGSIISHTSSNGKTFVQRLQEAGKYSCGAENVYVGSFSALESLITLLIDNGVPDKGHRRNLLDPKFSRMGVSFQSAGTARGVLVQDFACP